MRQEKDGTSKQRGKYASCSNISQPIEEKHATAIEDPGVERISGRVEKISRQRETMTVDRRWEIELLSQMKEKLLTKYERRKKATVKRVVWGINYVTKLVQYIIRMYANAAFRFVSLRSNRSYIPGD